MKNALIVNCSPVRNGATAYVVDTMAHSLSQALRVKSVCIDDYKFDFCKGCRVCHNTARCVMEGDGAAQLLAEYEWADIIVCVSPSYWADVPGQFKAFIDRCTPWCNTHEPHATLSSGKKGYCVALRTGPSMRECARIIESIEHFHGHLKIESCGSLRLCSVEWRSDAEKRKDEILEFCNATILNAFKS